MNIAKKTYRITSANTTSAFQNFWISRSVEYSSGRGSKGRFQPRKHLHNLEEGRACITKLL